MFVMLTMLWAVASTNAWAEETTESDQSRRIHPADHVFSGSMSLTNGVDGVPSLRADMNYEYVVADGAIGVGGEFTLITTGDNPGMKFGPRATAWFPGRKATPYVGGSFLFYAGEKLNGPALAGHAGAAIWASETSAITIGLDVNLLAQDGAYGDPTVLLGIPVGVMGLARKR